MKSHTKTSTNKLVDRFDNELRTLLINDLDNIKVLKDQLIHRNNQARIRTRLSVA